MRRPLAASPTAPAGRPRSIAKVVTAWIGWVFVTGCGPAEPAKPPVWQSKVVLMADSGLGGCAAGDLTAHEGDEIVATAQSGAVYLTVRQGTKFRGNEVAKLPGEMIQVAVGDADPTRAGLEAVCVGSAKGPEDSGGPGAAYLLSPATTTAVDAVPAMHSLEVLTDTALVHGVCVTDVDPSKDGPEIYTVGFSLRVLQAHRADKSSAYTVQEIGKTSGPGKCATAFGRGIAIGCANGAIHLVRPNGGALEITTLAQLESGVARIAANQDQLLVACDAGDLIRVDVAGEQAKFTTLHSADDKLRGAVFADLVPESPGLEVATAGYHKKLTILSSDPAQPKILQHFQDSDKFHHVARGEFGGIRLDGREVSDLVACGYSKNLTVFRRISR